MNKRNELLDLFKLILAIGVIFVHFHFEGPLGNFFASIGTTGVIVFFLISGYSCYKDKDSDNSKTILRRSKRIGFLTIVSIILYLIFTIIEQATMRKISDWASTNLTNPLLYIRMIFLGDFEFIHGDHLWFLLALLYGYLFMYLIERKRWRKPLLIALPFLALLRIVVETYTNSFGVDWHLSGNVIVGAIPTLSLGYFIHIYEEKLLKLDGKYWIAFLIMSYLLMYYSVNNKVGNLDISQIFKISTAALSYMVCLSYYNLIKPNFFSTFGRFGSLYIYVFHYLIGIALKDIFLVNGASESFINTFFPWIVVAISLIFAYILTLIERKIIKRN